MGSTPCKLMVLLQLVVGLHATTMPDAAGGGRFTVAALPGGGWTLVDRAGAPTFAIALNHLASPTYYDAIPGANGLAPCRANDTLCRQYDLLGTKYGGSWSAATADFVAQTASWGFNAAGYEYAPSAAAPGWPYLPDLFLTNASHIFRNHNAAIAGQNSPATVALSGGPPAAGGQGMFPDVFEPAWNASADARVAAWVARDQHVGAARVRADVLGYFFEDQALWDVGAARAGAAPAPAAGDATDWAAAMRAKPPSGAGKAAYVGWLRQRYGGGGAAAGNATAALAAARAVYGFPPAVATWADVRRWDFGGLNATSAAVLADDGAFLGVVAERLFGLGAAAVRRHDRGALVFGPRFLSHDAPAPVLAAAGRHFDAVSVQPSDFSPTTAADVAAGMALLVDISEKAGLPVFVADVSTHFREEPLPGVTPCGPVSAGHPAGAGCVANQSAAGAMYGAYIDALRQRPEVIGFAHCQYINRVVTSGKRGLHLKQGLLDFGGAAHAELVAAITAANRVSARPLPSELASLM